MRRIIPCAAFGVFLSVTAFAADTPGIATTSAPAKQPAAVAATTPAKTAPATPAAAATAKPAAAPAAPAKSTEPTADDAKFFNTKILPVLKQRCYECHSHDAKKIKGGLVVDSRDGMRKGGDSGPAVVPGKLSDSLLITSVRWEDKDFQMPPKDKLPDGEIQLFEQWIKMGAPDPRSSPAGLGDQNAIAAKARDHWSFKPVQNSAVPEVKDKAWPKTPVDNFILAKLESKGMKPSAAADRQTLIRRVTYDLTGLPPTTEEVRAFVEDKSTDAYTRLVDRLLASPRYGERWARYWLDVARYADTTGAAGVGGKDNRFVYAWTYRDYVVRSFNEDKGYDRFIKEQLAADLMFGKKQTDQRNLAALGFLTVGKRFTNPDDETDDRIDATSRAFLGLTVTCARCHDHKFDPIPTDDYYSWHGVFSSTKEPDVEPLIEEPKQTPEYQDFEKQIAEAEAKVSEYIDSAWEDHFDEHFAKMGKYLMAIEEEKKGLGGLSVSAFYLTRGLRPTIGRNWDLYIDGSSSRASKAVAKGIKPPKFDPIFEPWKAFAALPAADFTVKAEELAKRFAGNVDSSETAAPTANATAASAAAGTGAPPAQSKPEEKINPLVAQMLAGDPPKSLQEVADRYGKLFEDIRRQHHAKRAEALKAAGHWEAVDVKLDDANAQAIENLLYGPDSPVSREKLTFRAEVGVNANGKMERLMSKENDIRMNHPASPARALAVEDLPKPRNSHVFIRGDRSRLGPEVPRRFLTILGGSNAKPFTEGSGRLELAQGIVNKDNPLTARVMVNRVWLNHFGQGLVGTPSDFGLRGDNPTHPELLDYLARQFMDNGWSLKKLHRMIVLSATYQQRSDDVPKYREIDPTNTLVYKMNRRRLDVEAMRDTILADSGALDLKMGGHPVEILGDEPRRTIYSTINRENVPGFLANFDFALPEMSSPMRSESIVPTQALFLMNSPFVIEQARKLATLPDIEHAPNDESRVRQFYLRVFQRQPTKDDLADALGFLRQQANFKAEPPAKSDWKYGQGVPSASGKPLYFGEAKNFRFNEWVTYEKAAQVRVSETGGLTGATSASVRRWIAPMDGLVQIEGTLFATTGKSNAGVQAKLQLRHGNTAPQEVGSWKALKEGVATNVAQVEVHAGDTLDFIALPGGKVPESYTWAPSIHLLNVPNDKPEKHNWDSHSEFAGPPPPPPKGMTAWEKYAQALLLTNEFIYVN